MKIRQLLLSFILLLCFAIPLHCLSKPKPLSRGHYTLQEVLAECSNIVFGTVTSVNQKRMTAKVKVEEKSQGKKRLPRD